ncbi:MAG: protein phosphatase CheZ [Rhodocyclaceae bacterium]|nr:protein phosphatase CheZ [Rhodocyclaceae bacterium]
MPGKALSTKGKAKQRGAARLREDVATRKTTTTRSTKASAPADLVLRELKDLARELARTAKGLSKRSTGNPKEIAMILASVERITQEAATKSLLEAEAAKEAASRALASLARDWSRRELDELLTTISAHLTNIIVAQEFQDLAGQSLRRAMKALVGAIITVESGAPAEGERLSQRDVDALLKELMP